MYQPTGSSISCSTIAGARAPARQRGQRAGRAPRARPRPRSRTRSPAAPTTRSVAVAVRSAQTSQTATSAERDRLGPQQPDRPAQGAGNRVGVDGHARHDTRGWPGYSAAHAGRPGGQSEGHHHQRTQPGRAGPGAAQRGRPRRCATPGGGGTPCDAGPGGRRGGRRPGRHPRRRRHGQRGGERADGGASRRRSAPARPPAERLPALATVPGGSTNVFARALGLPRDWPEGTSMILEGLRLGRSRTIGLGRADDRYFTFCAGFGLDAAVVRRVEQARRRGRVSTPSLYLRSAVGQYFLGSDRRHPRSRLERPGRADGRTSWPRSSSRTPPRGRTWATGRSIRTRRRRSISGWTCWRCGSSRWLARHGQ